MLDTGKVAVMNAQSVALITGFAAVAIMLNAFRIPAVFWPGFFYVLSDIPVVIAFMLFGFRVGFLVEVLHIAGQEIFFPLGAGSVVIYPMALLVHLFMFSGIYLASKLSPKVASGKQFSGKKKTLYLTAFATAFRGGFMPIIDYAFLYGMLLPLLLRVTLPEAYIVALVPSFVLYNVTSTLYTVPIAHLIAKRVSKCLRIEMSI